MSFFSHRMFLSALVFPIYVSASVALQCGHQVEGFVWVLKAARQPATVITSCFQKLTIHVPAGGAAQSQPMSARAELTSYFCTARRITKSPNVPALNPGRHDVDRYDVNRERESLTTSFFEQDVAKRTIDGASEHVGFPPPQPPNKCRAKPQAPEHGRRSYGSGTRDTAWYSDSPGPFRPCQTAGQAHPLKGPSIPTCTVYLERVRKANAAGSDAGFSLRVRRSESLFGPVRSRSQITYRI